MEISVFLTFRLLLDKCRANLIDDFEDEGSDDNFVTYTRRFYMERNDNEISARRL